MGLVPSYYANTRIRARVKIRVVHRHRPQKEKKRKDNAPKKGKDTARITAHCVGTMMCNICFVQCLDGTMPHLRTINKMVGFNMYLPNPASRVDELLDPRRYQAADFETLHRL